MSRSPDCVTGLLDQGHRRGADEMSSATSAEMGLPNRMLAIMTAVEVRSDVQRLARGGRAASRAWVLRCAGSGLRRSKERAWRNETHWLRLANRVPDPY